MGAPAVVVRPVSAGDAWAVSRFLHQHLNPRVSADAWSLLLAPPWKADAPNHGFQLLDGDRIVGVYAAVYSEREIGGEPVPFCNLAAFCVLEEYRPHSLRLVRALLGQKGFVFTDLSPSGNVIALNERLGFQRLDTATTLVANLPRPAGRGTRVTTAPAVLDRVLTGRDAEVYRDHRQAPAAQHLLVGRDGAHGYLMFRRDRRKRLPLFATPLYAGGDAGCLEAAWPAVAAHLLLRHGLPLTLAERRILGFTPGGPGRVLAQPRPKMFRAEHVGPESIDHLYSELTLVRW
ncbi:hypothetical protein [Jiangella ureilytica]|uniref:hypothetical protein n=1 Tax=Jiangella ureilytica TaxID=2530374 RepID=UPI00193CFF28|nr:hypothetical protein [Jiangella ureilytica]